MSAITATPVKPFRSVPHKVITTGMRQKIKDLFEEGKSTSQICEIMDLNRSTVNSNLRAMGVHQRNWSVSSPKITPEVRQGIERAYRQGKTRKEIMIMFSISDSTAKLFEREFGLRETKKHNKISDKKKSDMCRYYRLGWTYTQIGEAVGLTANQVGAYISKQGLANRNASRQNKELLQAPLRLDGTPDIRDGEFRQKLEEKTAEAKWAALLKDEGSAKDLDRALKIADNSIYGRTLAKFANPLERTEPKEEVVMDILNKQPQLVVETERKVNVRGRFGMYCVRNGLFDMEMFTAGDAVVKSVDDLKALSDELAGAYEILKKEV